MKAVQTVQSSVHLNASPQSQPFYQAGNFSESSSVQNTSTRAIALRYQTAPKNLVYPCLQPVAGDSNSSYIVYKNSLNQSVRRNSNKAPLGNPADKDHMILYAAKRKETSLSPGRQAVEEPRDRSLARKNEIRAEIERKLFEGLSEEKPKVVHSAIRDFEGLPPEEQEKLNLARTDSQGNDIFHLAASSDFFEVIQAFQDSLSANPDQKNLRGETPLIICCQKGSFESARLLLSQAMDHEARDHQGLCALDHALKIKHLDIVDLLMNYPKIHPSPFHFQRRKAFLNDTYHACPSTPLPPDHKNRKKSLTSILTSDGGTLSSIRSSLLPAAPSQCAKADPIDSLRTFLSLNGNYRAPRPLNASSTCPYFSFPRLAPPATELPSPKPVCSRPKNKGKLPLPANIQRLIALRPPPRKSIQNLNSFRPRAAPPSEKDPSELGSGLKTLLKSYFSRSFSAKELRCN